MTLFNDNLDLISRTFDILIYILEIFDNKLLKYPKLHNFKNMIKYCRSYCLLRVILAQGCGYYCICVMHIMRFDFLDLYMDG